MLEIIQTQEPMGQTYGGSDDNDLNIFSVEETMNYIFYLISIKLYNIIAHYFRDNFLLRRPEIRER